jgi:hypothetical protein
MAIGYADKFSKLGGGNADTLTRTPLGGTGGTPTSPPFAPGSNGQTIAPEPTLLVEPVIASGVPAP